MSYEESIQEFKKTTEKFTFKEKLLALRSIVLEWQKEFRSITLTEEQFFSLIKIFIKPGTPNHITPALEYYLAYRIKAYIASIDYDFKISQVDEELEDWQKMDPEEYIDLQPEDFADAKVDPTFLELIGEFDEQE